MQPSNHFFSRGPPGTSSKASRAPIPEGPSEPCAWGRPPKEPTRLQPIRIRFRGNWGLRAKPKAKPSARRKSKSLEPPNQTLHPPGLHGSKTKKKTGARETSSGGNWGPQANPKSTKVGPADPNSPPCLEETGGLEPNPKPNLLPVATGSRLDSLQAKSLEPGPTKHGTRLVYTGRRNKKEDRSARGPRANPRSKPCARLVGTCATNSRQVSSQTAGNWGLEPNPKPNLLSSGLAGATGSRLDSLQAKSLEPDLINQTLHPPGLDRMKTNKLEDRSAIRVRENPKPAKG